MRARQRPASQHGAQPYAQATPNRKVFNCIVDDTALVAGVKKSTRNGIRQWVKNGQIRLFVPLHALEQLSRQKASGNRHGQDVRETLEWLDDATSKYPHAVTLQGGDQYYQKWAEVERFAVPRTLFSENDHLDEDEPEPEVDAVTEETANKLTLSDDKRQTPVSSAASNAFGSASPSSMQSMRSSVSPVSPPTSPTKVASSPGMPPASLARPDDSSSSSAIVPTRLQPLFNYILWRIHQELDPVAALESFIFLCNDANKVYYARGFDIRSKRLEQLREAVGREDRDFKNRQVLQNRENQSSSAQAVSAPTQPTDDDEVVYKPPPRAPAAMLPKPQLPPNVIDPNAFGRTPHAIVSQEPAVSQPKSPRLNNPQPQIQSNRGGMPFAPRGNARGGPRGGPRGRASFTPTRGNPSPGRGTFNGAQNSGPIDPESFTRPRGSGYTGRGGRKLWVPE